MLDFLGDFLGDPLGDFLGDEWVIPLEVLGIWEPVIPLEVLGIWEPDLAWDSGPKVRERLGDSLAS